MAKFFYGARKIGYRETLRGDYVLLLRDLQLFAEHHCFSRCADSDLCALPCHGQELDFDIVADA